MKTKSTNLLVLVALVYAMACNNPKPDKNEAPPYTVQLEEIVVPGLPDLHSYTKAIYQDKMIMIGGRTNGLHSGTYNFRRAFSNRNVYVISTNGWSNNTKEWKVDSLDYTRIKGTLGIDMFQFYANNAQFFTEKNVLYVVGGMLGSTSPTRLKIANNPNSGIELVPLLKTGKANPADTLPRTLPYFTAINLSDLVNTVLSQGKTPMPANAIRQVKDTNFTVTGGELDLIGDTVHLVFGWNFPGPREAQPAGPPIDYYTHQVRRFTYNDNGQKLTANILPICATCTDGEPNSSFTGYYRRRDGSMSTMIDPADGSEAIVYYSGVFKNGNTNFTSPVWIKNGATDTAGANSDTMMRSNVYTCQVIPCYSKKRNRSYATLLGGMKNAVYNGKPIDKPTLLTEKNAPFTPADITSFTSIPFSNQFTTLVIANEKGKKNYAQYLLPDSFPKTFAPLVLPPTGTYQRAVLPAGSVTYNGSEAELFWTLQSGLLRNGVIDYDVFSKENPKGAVIGYLHGGIQSVLDNVFEFTGGKAAHYSLASNRIFKVKVVPLKK